MALHNPFKRTHRPHHVPPTGPITIDRNQFATMTRTVPALSQIKQRYAVATTAPFADEAMRNFYTESLRGMTPTGQWIFGGSNAGAARLSFPDDAGLQTFLGAADMVFDMEATKIRNRWTYISQLKARATGGTLKTQLDVSAEDEASYYTASAAPIAARGAPMIPAPTATMVEHRKATAFLKSGVRGDASAYGRTFRAMLKTDGTFPLGSNETLLRNAWPALVPGAPNYRGWNSAATQQRYPSDTGGRHLLNRILADMSTTTMPTIGSDRWYDYALYVYGAIMTAQPFTDGNKRMCRLAYCLMLASGGVPFKAPNGALGGQLADMM